MAPARSPTLSFLLPALGFAIGPIFKKLAAPLADRRAAGPFPGQQLHPGRHHAAPGIGEAGNTTVYVRRYNPALDKDPAAATSR